MNTYDPAQRIHYIHMSGRAGTCSSPLGDGPSCTELPHGYANKSPQTRLRHRPAHVRADQESAPPSPRERSRSCAPLEAATSAEGVGVGRERAPHRGSTAGLTLGSRGSRTGSPCRT